jgi:hypothetical protein
VKDQLWVKVYGCKENNKFSASGYIYCWYYEIRNARTGELLASDNTGDGYKILAYALRRAKELAA